MLLHLGANMGCETGMHRSWDCVAHAWWSDSVGMSLGTQAKFCLVKKAWWQLILESFDFCELFFLRILMLLGKLVVSILQVKIGFGIPHWKEEEKSSFVVLINTSIRAYFVILLDTLELLIVRILLWELVLLPLNSLSPPFWWIFKVCKWVLWELYPWSGRPRWCFWFWKSDWSHSFSNYRPLYSEPTCLWVIAVFRF